MSAANGSRSPGQNWVEIIGRKSFDAFAAAFTEDAVLEASVLRDPVKGPSGIRSVFSATAAMYETFAFTHETTQGSKTYLEWEGKALGGLTAAGVTVLTRNAIGKIESVRLMHRPLPDGPGVFCRTGAEVGGDTRPVAPKSFGMICAEPLRSTGA
jgi:hypothetical protein